MAKRPTTTEETPRTLDEVIELGVSVLGKEIARMGKAEFLEPEEGQQLSRYIQAAVAIAKEQRESKAPGKLSDDQLDAEIAKQMGVSVERLREFIARERQAS